MAKGQKPDQMTMKVWYDKQARKQSFEVGDQVLALLPIPGSLLQARYSGQFAVDKKLNEVNYIINTPAHHKQQHWCHTNVLKLYQKRKKGLKSTLVAAHVVARGGERLDWVWTQIDQLRDIKHY